MGTPDKQKRSDMVTQYTDEKWRDELSFSSKDLTKEEAEEQFLPLWVKLLDSNWLIFAVLPLLLWVGIYFYSASLPQVQAARIAGMCFWGTGILATGSATLFIPFSRGYANRRGRLLYFDSFKKLYETYRTESELGRLLAGTCLILSLPLRFGLGSFLGVGIPFWFALSY